MSFVGIIANPASGKDVRRVASHAITANNYQKTNIARRMLVALQALEVQRIEIMPDQFGIGTRALQGLKKRRDIQATTSLIDMPVSGTAEDTLQAAHYLRQASCDCIVLLGGDGTCRVAAKGCGEVPILPISSGTNNVVPYFVEGTADGLAAAYIARRPLVERERFCYRHKQLLVHVNGRRVDEALVDIALLSSSFTGSRAIWDTGELRQVFVTRAQPFHIGLSSVWLIFSRSYAVSDRADRSGRGGGRNFGQRPTGHSSHCARHPGAGGRWRDQRYAAGGPLPGCRRTACCTFTGWRARGIPVRWQSSQCEPRPRWTVDRGRAADAAISCGSGRLRS